MKTNLISFWQSRIDTDVIRILYQSVASWELTMMADVNLKTEAVEFYNGKSQRSIISEFEISTIDSKCNYRKMNTNGNDLTLINNAKGIIDRLPNSSWGYKAKDLKTHIDSFCSNYNYTYTDVTMLSPTAIMDLINNEYITNWKSGETKSQYYCGITNDIDIRMQQHREEDFKIENNSVHAWICASKEVATEVEELADKEDYDVGKKSGTGGVDSSILVYFLKKA